jgi:hypothetical protein
MRAYRLLAESFSALLLLLLLLTVLATQPAVASNIDCHESYTVARGDSVSRIAQRFGISYAEMLRLNPAIRRNPNLIHAGQILCLSDVAIPTGDLTLEVTYEFTPTSDELALGVPRSQSGHLGKRWDFNLVGIDASSFISQPEAIGRAITVQPSPIMLAVRQGDATTYMLVFVGQQGKLLMDSLQFSNTLPLTVSATCCGKSIDGVLADTNIRNVDAALWFESPNGLRFPFPIGQLDYRSSSEAAAAHYRSPGLRGYVVGAIVRIVSPATPDAPPVYSAQILLNDGVFGPPGLSWRSRCSNWATKRGLVYRWLYSFAGCRRR